MKKLLRQAVLQVHLPDMAALVIRLLLPTLFLMWQLLTLLPTHLAALVAATWVAAMLQI